jgi:putative redox protein
MGMEVMIEHLGEVQFEVKARHHTMICDQPVEAGGYDEGVTPPEFLLAALGTCAGYYAAQYLKAQKLPGHGLRIRASAGKEKAPARMDHFAIDIEYPAALSQRDRQGILDSVNKCLIHNTLTHPPEINVKLLAS